MTEKIILVEEIAYGTTQPIGSGGRELAVVTSEWEIEC